MPTNLAQVRVTRVEAGGGFMARCACGWSVLRPIRLAADVAGQAHQRQHVTPDPADQVSEL